MAALPDPPLLMSVEEYLATSFPDGDREYLDGVVVERNLGTPGHSRLQKILIAHLAASEASHQLEVLPECRMRITETRYRVPDTSTFPTAGDSRSTAENCWRGWTRRSRSSRRAEELD